MKLTLISIALVMALAACGNPDHRDEERQVAAPAHPFGSGTKLGNGSGSAGADRRGRITPLASSLS